MTPSKKKISSTGTMASPKRRSSRVTKRKFDNVYEYGLARKKTSPPSESHQRSMQKPKSNLHVEKKKSETKVKKTLIQNMKSSNQRKKKSEYRKGNVKGIGDDGLKLTSKIPKMKFMQKNGPFQSVTIHPSVQSKPNRRSRSHLGHEENICVTSGDACHRFNNFVLGDICVSSSTQQQSQLQSKLDDITGDKNFVPGDVCVSSSTQQQSQSNQNLDDVTSEKNFVPGDVFLRPSAQSNQNLVNVTYETISIHSEGCEDTSGSVSPQKKLLVAQLQLSPVVSTDGQLESKSQESTNTNALTSSLSSSDSPGHASGRRTRNRKAKLIAQLNFNSDLDPSVSSGGELEPKGRSEKHWRRRKFSKKIVKLPVEKEDSNRMWTLTEKGWCCSYCQKHFKSLKLVRFHLKSHSGVKRFSCSYCGQKFSLKSNMQHHEQLHSEDKPYMCEVCGKCFKTSAYCKAHGQIHRTEKVFKCDSPNCGKSFSSRRSYHVHQLCHRSVKSFKCNDCGKLFRRKSDLNIHSSVHSNTKLFRCDVCQKRFSHKYALNAHSLLHRKRPFNCRYCRRFFAAEVDKNIHETVHYQHPLLECEICHLENLGLRQLGTHLRKVHGVEPANIKCFACRLTFPSQNSYDKHCGTETSLSCFRCDKVLASSCEMYSHRNEHKGQEICPDDKICNICNFCGKEFRRLSSLTKHKLIHETGKLTCEVCGKEAKNSHSLKIHVKSHNKKKSFSCVTCGKSFGTKLVLEQHVLIHTGAKPHACGICLKSFRTKAMLKEHASIHGERNLFKCELCGKEYASKTNYKNHMNVHKGNRNFECKVCGKRFFAKYVMRKHMQIHTGTKNYQCEYCGKKFIQHGNWLIHRRSHTGERPHGCDKCPAAFVNSSQLKAHVKRVHDQKKEFMCDKCYKHFYTRKGLQAHMRNIHLKKENGQIYHCGKCDRLFALQENHLQHESSCTGLGKILPCLRPSVLQTVLQKVYSHEARKVGKSLKVQTVILPSPELVTETNVNLIQEPVQLITEDTMDQHVPVPVPVQQFQVISEAKEHVVESEETTRELPVELEEPTQEHVESREPTEEHVMESEEPTQEHVESEEATQEHAVELEEPTQELPVESVESTQEHVVESEEPTQEHPVELEDSTKVVHISARESASLDRNLEAVSCEGTNDAQSTLNASAFGKGGASAVVPSTVTGNTTKCDMDTQLRSTASSPGKSACPINNSLNMCMLIQEKSLEPTELAQIIDLSKVGSVSRSYDVEEPCSVRNSFGVCSKEPTAEEKPAIDLETSNLHGSSSNQSDAAMTSKSNTCSSVNKSWSIKCSDNISFSSRCTDTELQCRLCPVSFRSEFEARKHLLEAHSDQLFYQCSICSQRFASSECLTSHLLTHIVSSINRKEPQTSSNVSSDVNLLQPTNNVSSDVNVKQPTNNVSSSVNLLQPTNNVSSDVNVKQPADSVSSKVNLLQPANNLPYDGKIMQPVKTNSSTNEFEAHHSHRISSTNRRKSLNVEKESLTKEYSCKGCRTEFPSRAFLEFHQVYQSCRRQVKRGTYGAYLYKHHKEYECCVCNKRFRSRSVWQLHKRTHDSRSYQCKQCPEKILFLKNFKNHKHAHSNIFVGSRTISFGIPQIQIQASSSSDHSGSNIQVSHPLTRSFSVSGVQPIPSASSVSVQPCTSGYHQISSVQPIYGVQPVSSVQPSYGVQSVSSVQPTYGVQLVSSVQPISGSQQVSNVQLALGTEPDSIIQPGINVQFSQQIQENLGHQTFSKCSVSRSQTTSVVPASQKEPSQPNGQPTSNLQSTSSNQPSTNEEPTTGHQPTTNVQPTTNHQPSSYLQSTLNIQPGTNVQPPTGHQQTTSYPLDSHVQPTSAVQPVDGPDTSTHSNCVYSCSVCQDTFPSQELLSAHCDTHVLSHVRFLCQICNLHFEEETEFTDHIKLHGDVVLEVGQKEEVLEVEEVSDTSHVVTLLSSL